VVVVGTIAFGYYTFQQRGADPPSLPEPVHRVNSSLALLLRLLMTEQEERPAPPPPALEREAYIDKRFIAGSKRVECLVQYTQAGTEVRVTI